MWFGLRFGFAFLVVLSLFALPAKADPVKVEVGYIPILAATPLLVIEQEGWAKQEGIDLKLTRFEAGPAAIQALAAGRIDVMYAGVAPVLVARSSGAEVSVIANSAVEELALVGRGELAQSAKGKSAKEAIESLAATKGRKVKIGTQPAGSVPDTVLRYWLQVVAKIGPDKVDVLPMGIEKTQQALMAGAIDAAMIREPTITIVGDRDPQSVILAAGSEMFPNQPGTVVAARRAFLRDHADAAAKLVKLHVKAVDLIAKDKSRAARAAQEYIGKGLIDLTTTERALSSPSSKFVADPHVIVAPCDRLQAFQKDLGTVNSTVPVAEAFDFAFYDAAVGK